MKIILYILILFFISCSSNSNPDKSENARLDNYLKQYKPYKMAYDLSDYSEMDKLILQKLIQAAAHIDTIYWQQTSKYGMALRDSLQKIEDDPISKKLLTLLVRNGGPFEQLNHFEAFMGNQVFYPGGEVYPHGMTVDEFDAYYETLSIDEQAKFMSPYTVIREDSKGGYMAVPYYQEYKDHIDPIVKLLNECADLTENASFAKFLRLKAKALVTDDYFDTDVTWIEMEDNKFDMVFGPFETYSDGIKGVKAKYEAEIEIVDQNKSKKLSRYTKHLPELEKNLPVPDIYKSVSKGLDAKFAIVKDILRAGEGAYGYQAVATNLPNDPVVEEKKGTKKTFWINMFEARFNAIIKPVSSKVINESQLQYLSDDGFFQFVLMHEICHAVGPTSVKTGPKKGSAINAAIGPNYNALEECKADIAGLYSLAYLIDVGEVDKEMEKSFYVSFLGSMFRSIRFGLDEAHAKASAIALNYLLDQGSLLYNSQTGRWSVNFDKFRDGIKNLTADLVILEGDGDNGKVEEFFSKWAILTPQIKASLEAVEDLAIDVLPQYSIKWN